VLGLIAALTLPSIFNSVNASKIKTNQKDAIQAIQQMIYQGHMNGDFSSISNWGFQNSTDPIVAYVTSKLNAKQCPKGTTTGGCNHNWVNSGASDLRNDHSGRWVLPSGTQVWFHLPSEVNSTYIGFLIDAQTDGTSTHSAVGADQVSVKCNISDVDTTYFAGTTARPGQCVPWNVLHKITYDALYK
jgi:type II secretory pathway pseudopilin PulG